MNHKKEKILFGREIRKTFRCKFPLAMSLAKSVKRINHSCSMQELATAIAFDGNKFPPKIAAMIASGAIAGYPSGGGYELPFSNGYVSINGVKFVIEH